jgi:GTPase
MKSVISLVGRPNVGKSTLFNRLSKNIKAIVHDLPGVTRDRKYGKASLGPIDFTVVDTPGLEQSGKLAIEERMMGQTFAAVASSDLVCLVVDGSTGVTPEDEYFANILRKQNKQILLLANKCEKNVSIDKSFYKLGFGEPICISAEHGIGMMELCEAFMEKIDFDKNSDDIEDPFKSNSIQIAITGRPNAGKSTFINAIIGEQRLLTGSEAGITRDAVSINWKYKNNNIILVDTAGVRKRAQVSKSLEKLSVSDTMYSIRFANVVVLMIDAELGLEQQDLNIANYIISEGRAIVLAINKWDLIRNKEEYKDEIKYKISKNLSDVKSIPVAYISSSTSQNINKVIDCCIEAYDVWNKRISTAKINNWLIAATENHPLPLAKGGRRVRIKYITQIKSRPPTFKLFTNYPDSITDSYQKYLINSLRDEFEMPGVPIRLSITKTDNPYKDRK